MQERSPAATKTGLYIGIPGLVNLETARYPSACMFLPPSRSLLPASLSLSACLPPAASACIPLLLHLQHPCLSSISPFLPPASSLSSLSILLLFVCLCLIYHRSLASHLLYLYASFLHIDPTFVFRLSPYSLTYIHVFSGLSLSSCLFLSSFPPFQPPQLA